MAITEQGESEGRVFLVKYKPTYSNSSETEDLTHEEVGKAPEQRLQANRDRRVQDEIRTKPSNWKNEQGLDLQRTRLFKAIPKSLQYERPFKAPQRRKAIPMCYLRARLGLVRQP